MLREVMAHWQRQMPAGMHIAHSWELADPQRASALSGRQRGSQMGDARCAQEDTPELCVKRHLVGGKRHLTGGEMSASLESPAAHVARAEMVTFAA